MATLVPLTELLRTQGFAFTPAADMAALLGPLPGWDAFAASWNDLGPDTYMADGGRYRKRRHAVLRADATGIARQPHQPHYQSRDYNALNGGIERWFAPVTDDIAASPALTAILRFCQDLFTRLLPASAWHIEIHQFRIEARSGQQGRPTPEGMHRDGVDYVLVLLVRRQNIASGMTTVHDLTGHELGHFTLTTPLDSALVDDQRVMHGVTPVEPLDPAEPAYRDVLVVTFRRQPP